MAKTSSKSVRKHSRKNAPPHVRNKTAKRKAKRHNARARKPRAKK